MSQVHSFVPIAKVEHKIHLIRGQKVMLDRDLAAIYGVPTFRLNEAVKRNRKRFPPDFMFQLNKDESISLTSQIAMSKERRGGRRTLPYVFTEHGVAMLSTVLRSERAIQMNIAIMRAFIRLREMIAAHKELAARIEKLEKSHGDHVSILSMLIEEIRTIKALPEPSKRRIGFHSN
jgi:hypothetical protein